MKTFRKKSEVIKEACSIVYLVYNTIGDYSDPCDCFCEESNDRDAKGWSFTHSDKVLKYIEQAVKEKLLKDGYKIKEKII